MKYQVIDLCSSDEEVTSKLQKYSYPENSEHKAIVSSGDKTIVSSGEESDDNQFSKGAKLDNYVKESVKNEGWIPWAEFEKREQDKRSGRYRKKKSTSVPSVKKEQNFEIVVISSDDDEANDNDNKIHVDVIKFWEELEKEFEEKKNSTKRKRETNDD